MPTVTLYSEYDGWISRRSPPAPPEYYKTATDTRISVGKTTGVIPVRRARAFIQWSLDPLPLGAQALEARFRSMVSDAGDAGHQLDVHAYGVNGQDDPALDDGATLWDRCASGHLYHDDGTEYRSTGEKWITLAGDVHGDLQAAKALVNRFSLALHEEGDDNVMARVWGRLGLFQALRLEITYEMAPYVQEPERPAEERRRKFDVSMDPDTIRRRLQRQRGAMREQAATATGQMSLVEAKVKRLCEAAGVSTVLIPAYLGFARELHSLGQRLSGTTREDEVTRSVTHWTSRGLNGDLLIKIVEICA